MLRYRGLGNSGDFTFYADSHRAPELDGKPIDFSPGYAFDSPFLRETWASGKVHIQKGHRTYAVDVREKERP